jgi:hypothetical protein
MADWQMEVFYWKAKYQKLAARIETASAVMSFDPQHAHDEDGYSRHITRSLGEQIGVGLVSDSRAHKVDEMRDEALDITMRRVTVRVLLNSEEEDN